MSSENPVKKDNPTERPDPPPKEHSGNAPPLVPPVTAVPQPPILPNHHYTSCKKKRDKYDYIKFGLESFGLVVLVIYTIFAGLQWCAIRETNRLTDIAIKNAKDNFAQANRLDQLKFRKERRPYVEILEISSEMKRESPTSEWKLAAIARNFGESPARGVYAYAAFKPDLKDWRPGTCKDVRKTVDWKSAGPAIFQHTDKPDSLEIDVEPTTLAWPPPVLAICISFMDMEGPFWWTDYLGTRCTSYTIKQAFAVIPRDRKLTFVKAATSVETAEPKETDTQPCEYK